MQRPASGATALGRSLMLVALLVGILAMHGLSVSRWTGAHAGAPPVVSPPTASTVHVDHSSAAAARMHEPAPVVSAVLLSAGMQRAAHPDDRHDGHGVLVGCVLALAGLAVVLVLRRHALTGGSLRGRGAGSWSTPRAAVGRPPPEPWPRISLCILRV
jgi:hypothetical protein